MGFRFRKSVKMGPFRINFSKSGVGWSVGGKGYRYTKTANGRTRTTISAPGTGMSYVHETGSKKKVARNNTASPRTTNVNRSNNVHSTPINMPSYSSPVSPAKNSTSSQWPVKDNSIFDKIAKWIDKTFFGSEYNLTPEKLMIVALCTNIFGIYRIYAGRKIAAVVSWIFLLFSFITRDWMLLFTLPWFVIDLIRIYLGNYGRLKFNRKFNFNAFKALVSNKKRAQSKAISGGISVIVIILICTLCPSAETIPAETGSSINAIAAVSQSDYASKAAETLTTTTELQTTTTVVTTTTEPPTTTTKKATTTTKKKTTTTTKKKTTTSSNKRTIILNTDTKCYHLSSTCRAAKKIKASNKKVIESTIANVKAQGYSACGICAK